MKQEEIINRLYEIPQDMWAELWCRMNRWELPDELFPEKPEWFNAPPFYGKGHLHSGLIRPVMKEIVDTIGDKAVSWEWNKKSMTKEEHDNWYRNQRTKIGY